MRLVSSTHPDGPGQTRRTGRTGRTRTDPDGRGRTGGRADGRMDGRTDGADGADRYLLKIQNSGSDLEFVLNSNCGQPLVLVRSSPQDIPNISDPDVINPIHAWDPLPVQRLIPSIPGQTYLSTSDFLLSTVGKSWHRGALPAGQVVPGFPSPF